MSALHEVSLGQVQSLQSCAGVQIIEWYGNPGDTDTVIDAVIVGPWSDVALGGFRVPLVFDRYSARGRLDITADEGKLVTVLARYSPADFDIIRNDSCFTVTTSTFLTLTVPTTDGLQ